MSPYFVPDYSVSAPSGYSINSQLTGDINPNVSLADGSQNQENQSGADVWGGGGVNYGTAALGAASMVGDLIAEAHSRIGLPQYSKGLQYSNGRPSYSGDQWGTAKAMTVRSDKLTEDNWQKLQVGTAKGFAQG